MIDNIVGMASLPIGIVLFLNILGVTKMTSLFGIDILLIASIVLILVQVSNIVGAHIMDENVVLSYVIHFFLIFPSVIYFVSLAGVVPAAIVAALPAIFASFILVEGMYSFFF